MNIRTLLMVIGLCGAAYLALFANKEPNDGIAEAVSKPQSKMIGENLHQKAKVLVVEQIIPRERLINNNSEKNTENIFTSQSWGPPPTPIVSTPQVIAPTAPPMPFLYVGKKFEDGVYEVYLTLGEKTYAVKNDDVLENIYRIDSIKPPILTLTYLPLNQTQSLQIGAGN